MNCNQYALAIEVSKQGLSRSLSSDDRTICLVQLAEALDRKGCFDDAELYARKSFDRAGSGNTRAAMILATCAFLKDRYQEAIDRARLVLYVHQGKRSRRENRVKAGLILAYSAASLRQWEVARLAAEEVLPLFPGAHQDWDGIRDQLRAHLNDWQQAETTDPLSQIRATFTAVARHHLANASQ
jgi:tetratricopeptide (TPR) repeat protein